MISAPNVIHPLSNADLRTPGTRIPPAPKATMIEIEGNPVWITETRALTRDAREGWIEERTEA